jgi:hypothetical protein
MDASGSPREGERMLCRCQRRRMGPGVWGEGGCWDGGGLRGLLVRFQLLSIRILRSRIGMFFGSDLLLIVYRGLLVGCFRLCLRFDWVHGVEIPSLRLVYIPSLEPSLEQEDIDIHRTNESLTRVYY